MNITGIKDISRDGNIPFRYSGYAFGYVTEGEALVEIEGENCLIGPGHFILIPEGKAVILRHMQQCSGFYGCFSIDFLKDVSYQVLRVTEPSLQSFWFDDAVFIAALMKRMCTACEDNDRKFLQSGMDMVLSQIRPGTKVASVPERFLQLVFQRDKAPLPVSEYARILGVSPNYLNKIVKNHTHRTAMDWVEIARLNLAKQLLKDRSIPVVEVAERCGIDDQSYFARFFKKKTGLTPSRYRDSQ